jgi:hypothetical protein
MEETEMKVTLSTLAIAVSTFACALSFSTSSAEARARVYIHGGYAVNATYYTATGLPWYAVRAYYFGGPWSGAGYSYTGWGDYAGRNGIACVPGSVVKGGDGILYNCQ